MGLDYAAICPLRLLMDWKYMQQLTNMDLKTRKSLIGRSHVMREWSRVLVGLEDLTGQSYLFEGSDPPCRLAL